MLILAGTQGWSGACAVTRRATSAVPVGEIAREATNAQLFVSMTSPVVSIPLNQHRPVVLADLIPFARAKSVVLVVAGAAIVGLLAQISVPLPFTPVPITGQTLGAVLVGAGLGWKRGVLALGLYTLVGLAGMPWFAGQTSGWAAPSFGYILGMVLAAGICGWLAERQADRTARRALPAMLISSIAIYAVGVPWLAVAINVGPAEALSKGLYPFLVGDVIKVLLAAGALPTAWRIAGRRGLTDNDTI